MTRAGRALAWLRGSIRGRMVGLAALWLTLALVGAYLVIGTVLERFVTARFDAELSAVADTLIAGADIDATGQLAVSGGPADPRYAMPLSGWYWQFDEKARPVAKSPSLFDATLSLPAQTGTAVLTGPRGVRLRGIVRAVSLPDAEPLVLAVAAPQAEIDSALVRVHRPLAMSLLVLGLGLALATFVQLRAGLASLDALERDIRTVREGRADALPSATMAELQPAVDELNALIAENRALVGRAREHLGNLAHSLKTPLAALANALPPDHPGQPLIARMDRQIGWHLRRARSAAGASRRLGARTGVAETADDILLVLRRELSGRGIAVDLDIAPGAGFAGDRQDLQEMMGNLMENAAKWARARIRVTARINQQRLTLSIADDGPGMADEDHARALSRGVRLDETGPSGSGLGLGIVADLARLHGGALTLGRSAMGGLEATLSLPA